MERPAPDVLIVGAGVMGATVAYEAARQGMRVHVVDGAASPEERDRRGATGGSLGGLTWLGVAEYTAPLALEGLDRHRLLSTEIGADTSFRPHSLLTLATDESALSSLRKSLERARRFGFVGQEVGPDEAVHLEPALVPASMVGGVLCEQGLIEAPWFTQTLLDAAVRLGASIDYGVQSRALLIEHGRCTGIESDGGPLFAGQVVVAAGAWAMPLLSAAGLDIPVLFTHAEFLQTDPLPPLFSHIITDAAANRVGLERAMGAPEHRDRWREGADIELVPHAIDFDLAQFPGGRVHIGQVSRAIPAYRTRPTSKSESMLRGQLRRFFPAVADARASLRLRQVAISADLTPVVGAVPDVEGLLVASALPSPLISAPALALRMAGLLRGEPQPDLAPFDPGRFARAGRE